jgi:hypothetical protein
MKVDLLDSCKVIEILWYDLVCQCKKKKERKNE